MKEAVLRAMDDAPQLFQQGQDRPFSAAWMIEHLRAKSVVSNGYKLADIGLVLFAKGMPFRHQNFPTEEEYCRRSVSAFFPDINVGAAIDLLRIQGAVGVSIASALLAWAIPERFAVIDRHSWRALKAICGCKGPLPNSFSIRKYEFYLKNLREVAEKRKVNPQLVDVWLYNYSRQNLGPLGGRQ